MAKKPAFVDSEMPGAAPAPKGPMMAAKGNPFAARGKPGSAPSKPVPKGGPAKGAPPAFLKKAGRGR